MLLALPLLCIPSLQAGIQELPAKALPPLEATTTAKAHSGPDPTAVSPEVLGTTMDRLCSLPRLAGSPESVLAADFAAEVLHDAGMKVERPEYWCYLPRQTAQSLQFKVGEGDWTALDLREFGYEEDPRSLQHQIPPMHGLTAPGRAEGRLWYAGYGTENEFLELQRKYGAEMQGGIALVRYGALYRGLKVANAETFGFAGALLYTDRDDDGASKGDVLPVGPWRPSSGIQRGSVYNSDGDPLTPGWAALEHASRILPAQAKGMVRIPSLPVSSGNAALLMDGAKRKLGPLPSQVRLSVEQDPNLVRIQNVMGRVVGAKYPDEWVIFGAHRDAWGYGATDNGTGTTVLLETVRVVGEALERGWRPERTLIFATWDAEEWGLVGSTEWVEHYREELMEHAVTYVNMDVAATGPNFSASCTPGMVEALRAACEVRGIEAPKRLGVPGGGSDHVPFLELAGVEVVAFGFHGGSGVYHSALDTPFLIETHLDPGFQHHAKAAAFAVSLVQDLSRGDRVVDGRRNWVLQMMTQLERMPAETQEAELAKLKLQLEATRFALELHEEDTSEEGRSTAYRFHRAFLPEAGRSNLWRTNGYGSDWFPRFKQALTGGKDAPQLEEALEEILEGFREAR